MVGEKVSVETVEVEIWSDIACPFCYIGKRNFESGAAAAGVPVAVVYRSFILAPDAPADLAGGNAARLAEKFGVSVAEAQAMQLQIAETARKAGLAFDYDRMQPTNTGLAHQLLHHAHAHGRQAEMKERLLLAHFTEGGHVGRVEELADLAAEVGLDRAAVVRALTTGEHLDGVRADIAQAQAYGITGVPFYVIDGKYAVSGAQAPETFSRALTQARDERTPTP